MNEQALDVSPVCRYVLGMRVDATSYPEAEERILRWVRARAGRAVVCANVHMVMECFDRPGFQRQVNAADLVTSDGMPLVWALRWMGVPGARRVYGPDLTEALLGRAEREGVAVGFLGGTEETLRRLLIRVRERHPRIEIGFAESPPFRPVAPAEEEALLARIGESGVGILFVGLGCPKQEEWVIRHRPGLRCVAVAVGAAFDFLAGTKPQAPPWLRERGGEWLYRFLSEPKRLWHRYLVANPRFLWHFCAQICLRGGQK